jgi:hypothetical protein
MGTAEFEAKAGAITDLGYLLAVFQDFPTVVPELAPFTAPKTKFEVAGGMLIATVRPPAAGMPVPGPLRGLAITPAEYRAFGKFPNFFHSMINRMAPIEGVLAYDGDRVVDARPR